ncbi:MAG: asparagine synthetase B, partial [candidate division WOR-3 bacterium]
MLAAIAATASAQNMVLIPMDLTQTDHLKAYGIAYRLLQRGQKVEWLLNYRGGSFLFPADAQALKECQLNGVTAFSVSPSDVVGIRATIEKSNMQSVLLERPTR